MSVAAKPDAMEVEKMVEEESPTEDEYFEQELLDFLQIITSIQLNLSNKNKASSNATEPIDEIECIITRFKKVNAAMPSDQWTRVYVGLKQLSQIITKHSEAFESWTLLRDLFESAKKFRTKYPTAQSGQKQQIQKQKQKSMHHVLKFAKEFADDQDITTHEIKKMTKSVKQSKIKQIKKKAIKSSSESSISQTKQIINLANSSKSSTKSPVITKKTEKTKKTLPTKVEATKKPHHDRDRATKDHFRDRERDRNNHNKHNKHRHRSRSRSRSRDRHRRSRHHNSYRSRSNSQSKERTSPNSRSTRNTTKARTHEPDEWGLAPPIHTDEYIVEMCLYGAKQRDLMNKADIVIDDLDKIPVVYGDSEICHGFNEGRCRLDPCKYHHVCWSCKGRDHPSSQCPYKATRPYDAPPNHHKPCINWNMSGCPGGCLCTDRHICLFCRGHHPMRHSAVCLWKFNREIQMNKRTAFDAHKSIKERQNLNPIGQYEHLRLKDEENGTFQDDKPQLKQDKMRISNKQRMSMTPPPSMTIPTSFMAKSIEKDETVCITEICVLYNTPSGCPAKYGKNDDHLHGIISGNIKNKNANPNVYDGVCQLKHRCRECFGRHSFFDCPFRYHGIKCFIVNDIVRYGEFPKRVYVVNGFIDRRDSNSYQRYSKAQNYIKAQKRKELKSPKLKITEVGLDLTAAQIEIAASTLGKIVSSVKMQYKYPKMMIKELPKTISSQQVENKLRLLFHEKGIENIVKIQCTASQSNWIISFLSVSDRENACNLLRNCSMQARELKIALFDDGDKNVNSNADESDLKTTNNELSKTEDGSKQVEDEKSLQLITKDEVPVDEHLYYCTLCDIGLFEYGLLRQHLLTTTHISLVHRKGLKSGAQFTAAAAGNEEINLNECILCGMNVTQCTMSQHMTSNNHDNSNILMMLSLVRCSVSSVYHCRVCNINISNSREYFIHCNSEQHRSGLEEAIEPCPYFNKRGSGCQNDRCQFKHVCVGCNALTPIYRCKRCKNNEVCNMFNKGGAGCWYARGSCHRRHICHYCHGTHPKVGCSKLFPNCKKTFNNQGQEIKPGSKQPQAQTQSHNYNHHHNNNRANKAPPPPQQPPPPQSNYPYNQAPHAPHAPPPHYGRYPPPPNMPPPQYGRYPPNMAPNMAPPSYGPPPNYPYGPPPNRHQYPPQR